MSQHTPFFFLINDEGSVTVAISIQERMVPFRDPDVQNRLRAALWKFGSNLAPTATDGVYTCIVVPG